jgi:hypothetical protein
MSGPTWRCWCCCMQCKASLLASLWEQCKRPHLQQQQQEWQEHKQLGCTCTQLSTEHVVCMPASCFSSSVIEKFT